METSSVSQEVKKRSSDATACSSGTLERGLADVIEIV